MLGRDAEAEKKLMEQRQAAKLLQEAEAGFAQSPTVTPPVSNVASSSRAVDRPRGSKESSAGSGLLTPEEARRVREQVIRQRKQSHSPVDARRKKRESCDLPQDMTSRATGQDISRLTRAPSDSQRDSLPQDMTPAPTSAALRQAHADRDRCRIFDIFHVPTRPIRRESFAREDCKFQWHASERNAYTEVYAHVLIMHTCRTGCIVIRAKRLKIYHASWSAAKRPYSRNSLLLKQTKKRSRTCMKRCLCCHGAFKRSNSNAIALRLTSRRL